ncbi:MAG: hypothetical protein H6519_11730 [Microthrixaceae bacterium]|nr:hypothetical protein [Acidimicrobiales bacterium]MCB9405093.1 hypothetical protein [Microthrixaceae bacterium]
MSDRSAANPGGIDRTGSLPPTDLDSPVPPAGERLGSRQSDGIYLALALLATLSAVQLDSSAWRPYSLGPLARSAILTSVALPAVLRILRPGRWVIAMALLLTVVPTAVAFHANLTDSTKVQWTRTHDGGVIATRAAARAVMDGHNPYTVDYTRDLPPWWRTLGVNDRPSLNPLVRHYPYLPGAFLVQVPFMALSDVAGLSWDPRYIALGLLLVTAAHFAFRPEAPWARASAILTLGSAFTVAFATWGRNDAIPSTLFILACLYASRRPRLAALMIGVAVSFKFLFLIALPPLAWWVAENHGRRALRRWWPAPAFLAATCIPFALASPGAFIEDAILFNFGLTDMVYPASGIGLPVIAPGIFQGPVLAAATVVCEALALTLPLVIARRAGRLTVVPVAAAVGLWFLVLPSRTFQHDYLGFLVVLASTLWLYLDHPDPDPDRPIPADGSVPV